MKRIALKKAVKLWQMRNPPEGDHLPETTLRNVAEGRGDDSAFLHLAHCDGCRKRLWQLQQESPAPGDVEDYVLPLAASDGIPEEATWTTADHKYRIEFRRMLTDQAARAVLIVRVQPPFDLAGRTIVLRDANGTEVLRGTISQDGKVTAIVEDASNLVLKKLTISEN